MLLSLDRIVAVNSRLLNQCGLSVVIRSVTMGFCVQIIKAFSMNLQSSAKIINYLWIAVSGLSSVFYVATFRISSRCIHWSLEVLLGLRASSQAALKLETAIIDKPSTPATARFEFI